MADLASFAYIMPLLAFFLVFIVSYAVLAKTKVFGSNNFFHLFLSFLLSIIFIISPSASKFVMVSTPWVAVFILTLFFILLMLAFVHGKVDDLVKSRVVAVVIVAVLLVLFIISAINVFGPIISPYLPGSADTSLTVQQAQTKHFFTSPAVIGAIILLVIAAVTSYVLTKK